VSEVAFALGNGFMSALSQEAPYAARSKLEAQKGKPDAAVIWGKKYAEAAEPLTLRLYGKRCEERRYVQVAGKSLRVDTLDDFNEDQYERMLERVAAARLSLPVAGGAKQ